VSAITVIGPGKITVTYVSGYVTGGGDEIGPDGVKWKMNGAQSPLREAKGVSGGTTYSDASYSLEVRHEI
jgi:hypothetical protein